MPDSLSSTDGAALEAALKERDQVSGWAADLHAELQAERERTRVLEEALRKDRDWWTMADAESIAERFHEEYERLAPEFGYRTREESAVPWEQVPHRNRLLMIETVRAVTASLAAVAVEDGCCCGNGEAEDDRSAVLRCPVHGPGYEPRSARPVPAGEGADVDALLHTMHDACKFNHDTTVRAILEGTLHRRRYGGRDRDYQGNKCWCPHCTTEYRAFEPEAAGTQAAEPPHKPLSFNEVAQRAIDEFDR